MNYLCFQAGVDILQIIIDWLNRARICRCEACNTELNIHSYASNESLILSCLVCKEYYYRENTNSSIVKYTVPEGLMKLWQMDPHYSSYTGIPISEAYEPK